MDKGSDGRFSNLPGFVRRRRGVVFSLLFVGIVLAGSVVGGSALGSDTRAPAELDQSGPSATDLDSCTVIDEPGRYVLTADVHNDGEACLHVRSDDVVLDGDGHAVGGTGTDAGIGLLVFNGSANGADRRGDELENVTVRDLRVTDNAAGVHLGQVAFTGPEVTVRNVTASDNGAGFVTYGIGESSLVDVRATDNEGVGISVYESTFVDGRNVTVSDNGGVGLDLTFAVLGSDLTGVRATGNGGSGIEIGTAAVDNNVTDAYVADNDGAGVEFRDSTGTHLRNATIVDNRGPGVLSDFGNADRVENVTVANNSMAYDGRNNFGHYGAVADDFGLGTYVTASFDANVTGLDEEVDVPAIPRNATAAGPGVNLTVKDGDDAEPRATLSFPYDDVAVDNESRLAVLQYADGDWNVLTETSIDADDRRIEATTDQGGVVVPVLAADTGSITGNESTFVVNSTGEDEAFYYGFVVDGDVEAATDAVLPAEENEERITERNDGTTLVRGSTGNGYGDSFVVTGEIGTFGTLQEDPQFALELDGEDVTDRLRDEDA